MDLVNYGNTVSNIQHIHWVDCGHTESNIQHIYWVDCGHTESNIKRTLLALSLKTEGIISMRVNNALF